MIDFNEPFFVHLLARMDEHPSLIQDFEEFIRLGRNRHTACDFPLATSQRNLSPGELRLVLTHWKMTR